MRTSCRVRTSMIAGALLLVPALARAESPVAPYPPCDRTPTKGDSAAAEGAFQAGNASYGEADYDRAINYWEDAYHRDCTAHAMLLNLARAYEINGQKRHAVNALRTYVARNPNSQDEAQIKRRIEKLDEQIQAETAAAPPPPPPPGPAQPATTTAPPPAVGTPPPAQAEAPPSGGKRPIAPLIVAGAGAVVTVVGGIIFFTARSAVSDYENQCNQINPVTGDHQCPNASITDAANAAQHRETLGGVIGGVGLAAVAGGLVWYFVSKPSEPAPTTAVVPAIAPGFGGLEFATKF